MKVAGVALALAAALAVSAGTAGGARAGMEPLLSREEAAAMTGQAWGHSAAGQYLAGRLAQAENDYGSAADYLEGALAWDPNNLDLRRRVFLLMLAEGRLLDALPHARPLEQDGEDPVLPIVVRAAAAMTSGDYQGALGEFANLDNGGVAGLVRMLGQAWAAAGSGDMTAARATLDFDPGQPAWKGLIALHRALIEDVGGGNAADAYAAAETADAFRASRAASLYENFRARQADPSVAPSIATARQGLAEGFFSIAAALSQGERSLSALIYGQIGLHVDPKHDVLRLLVAQVIAGQDRYEEAAAMFATIPEASPYYYDAQISRARNLAQADRADQAVTVLQALADASPANAVAPMLLGDVLRRESRFEEAVAAYDEAAARIGDITTEDHWRLLYHRGIALERAGKWARAESDLLAALALKKDQPQLLNYLGYSWIDRGEHLQRAEEMVRRAVELRPEDGFIIDSLGWVYYRQGRYADAVRELERAVTLEPLDPVINEHLGDAYWQVGRKAEARFQWRRTLNLEPDDERVPELEKKLRCGIEDCTMVDKTD